MGSKYKNLIFTKHALSRMKERGINQADVYATWRKPDKSRYAKTKAAWVYHKNIYGQRVEVVAKKNEKGEWVIISVWSKETYKKKTEKRKSLLSCIYEFFRYNKDS